MNAARLLRHARRRAGMSQRALADAARVRQPAIARIESGAVSPRLETLAPLLAATGTTLELATRPGRGVDRSLIRASLARTPEERIELAGRDGGNLAAFVAAASRGSRR